MTNSWNTPALSKIISADVPDIQEKLIALAKADPSTISDVPTGAKRVRETSVGKIIIEEYDGTSWADAGKIVNDVDTLDGKHAQVTPAADKIPVRDDNGKLKGDITGNAATATTATALSEINPIAKGGTGASTADAARANLGTPPTSHASSQNTYGVGTASSYGHVKLSDTIGTQGVSEGISATPKLVNDTKTTIDASISSLSASLDSTDASLTSHVEDKNDPHETLPTGGTTGQVLTVTDSGEAWSDLPEVDLTGKANNDLSNVTAPTQDFKNMSVGWGMPDWSAGVTVPKSTSYSTAYVDSILIFSVTHPGGNTSYTIDIGDFTYTGSINASVRLPLTFLVPAGSQYRVFGTSYYDADIYPLKGESTGGDDSNTTTSIQVFPLSEGEQELQANGLYESLTALSTLSLSFSTPTNTQYVNIICVTFVSGETPTTLTLPTDDVILPADFSAVLANKKYELSFLYLSDGKWDMEWSVKDAV